MESDHITKEDRRQQKQRSKDRALRTHTPRLENKASRRRDAVVFLEEDNTLCVPFLIECVYVKDNEFP